MGWRVGDPERVTGPERHISWDFAQCLLFGEPPDVAAIRSGIPPMASCFRQRQDSPCRQPRPGPKGSGRSKRATRFHDSGGTSKKEGKRRRRLSSLTSGMIWATLRVDLRNLGIRNMNAQCRLLNRITSNLLRLFACLAWLGLAGTVHAAPVTPEQEDSCRDYATKSVVHNKSIASKYPACGLVAPWYSNDFNDHYNWCLSADK